MVIFPGVLKPEGETIRTIPRFHYSRVCRGDARIVEAHQPQGHDHFSKYSVVERGPVLSMNTAIIIRCFVYRALLRNAEMFKTKTVGTALSLYVWVLKLCSLLVVFAFTHLFHLLALCAFVYCCCFLVHYMWLQCLRLWKKETTWV